jgi:hypothetical protein
MGSVQPRTTAQVAHSMTYCHVMRLPAVSLPTVYHAQCHQAVLFAQAGQLPLATIAVVLSELSADSIAPHETADAYVAGTVLIDHHQPSVLLDPLSRWACLPLACHVKALQTASWLKSG